MKNFIVLLMGLATGVAAAAALPSEISVQVRMDQSEYVIGERIRAVIAVENGSADVIDARTPASPDKLILELYRASDRYQFEKGSEDRPYVAGFALLSGEGQKLEVYYGDHFPVDDTIRYLARAVLVHDQTRYESALKSFTVVPGLRRGGALQIFEGQDNLKR